MTLREDFEKAFDEHFVTEPNPEDAFLFGIRKAMDFLIRNEMGTECSDDTLLSVGYIRKLVKELDQ